MAEAGIFLLSVQLVKSDVFKQLVRSCISYLGGWSHQSNSILSFICHEKQSCCLRMRGVLQVLSIRHYYSASGVPFGAVGFMEISILSWCRVAESDGGDNRVQGKSSK